MVVFFSRSLRVEAQDGKCFTLQNLTIPKKGKFAGVPQWDNCGYYATLQQAAQAALQRGMATGTAGMSVQRLIDALERSSGAVAAACEAAPTAAQAVHLHQVVNEHVAEELFEEEAS